MLFLGTIGTPEFNEMNPGSQGAIHVQSTHCVAFGQDGSGLFLGNTQFNGSGIVLADQINDFLLCAVPP
jgi:hypothetical protein